MELSEQLMIWHIRIYFANKVGYTLWVSFEDKDVLLGNSNNLLLFKRKKSLIEFIKSEFPCNLDNFGGYNKLQGLIKENNLSLFSPKWTQSYNLQKISEIIAQGNWGEWDLTTCSIILDSLNMLWDIGTTLQEEQILRELNPNNSVGKLMSFLTFITLDELSELENYDATSIANIYSSCLNEIEKKCLMIF